MQHKLNITSGTTYVDVRSGLLQAEVLIPSIIAFACFAVTTVSLARSSKTQIGSDERAKLFRISTITIAIFTGVFLTCNLPGFVEQVMYVTTGFQGAEFQEKIIRNVRMWQRYGHFSSVFLLTLLNSALNPCLYLARMRQFRSWLSSGIGKCF